MNFFGLYVGDYERSTGHLSVLEHGVYLLMLMHFYGTERPLPSDPAQICHIIRAHSQAERDAVKSVTARFWRPLPEDFAQLCQSLGFDMEADKVALGAVMAEWSSDAIGGLVNIRALQEIARAHIRSEKARSSALKREADKRAKRAAAGSEGGA